MSVACCGQGCLHAPVLSSRAQHALAGGKRRLLVPPPSLGDVTGVTEERRWPGLAGEAAGPGPEPHGNPASHSAAERVVTSAKAVIRLLGTNLPQKSRGGGENLTSAILGATLQGGNGGRGQDKPAVGSWFLCAPSFLSTIPSALRTRLSQYTPVQPSGASQSPARSWSLSHRWPCAEVGTVPAPSRGGSALPGRAAISRAAHSSRCADRKPGQRARVAHLEAEEMLLGVVINLLKSY